MSDLSKTKYLIAYVRNLYEFLISKERYKKFPVRYYKKEILPKIEGSNYLEELIKRNEPFVAARFGSSELGGFHSWLKIKLGFKKKFAKKNIYAMSNNAGFFPPDYQNLMKYGQMMQELYRHIDLLAIFNIFMEDYVVDNFCKQSKLTVLRTIDPVITDWSRSLKGKKVLVIHPMAKLIMEQYAKREYLFEDKDRLPEFDLKVYPAIQTNAGEKSDRFKTWFDALDYMINDVSKIDFDIALIGAGAYGLLLAVKIKTVLGKKAIHIGGATQLLFGIKGKRWDIRKEFSDMYNEYWVRPSAKYIPADSHKVEGGCYW